MEGWWRMNAEEALAQFKEPPKTLTAEEALAQFKKPCTNACKTLDLNTGVQSTSIDAYKQIQTELGSRQLLVLQAFKNLKTATNLEVSRHIGLPINQVTPRTNELVKMGRLECCGKRRCQVSGKLVMVWWIKQGSWTY